MIGGGRNFGLGSLQKLLVSLVDQARDFTANQDAGLGKQTSTPSSAAFSMAAETFELLEEDAVLRARSFQNVKSVIAKPSHSFFISAFFSRCCHDSPDAVSIPNTDALLPAKQGNR